MKLPGPLRRITRRLRGLGGAPAVSPGTLRQAMDREAVLVLAFGRTDDRLPGEQRLAHLETLAETVAGTPRGRLIVTHCT